MIKLYVINADGKRWASRHDQQGAIGEARILSELYPDNMWEVYYSVYESIKDAIDDNVMICPECGDLMQHRCITFKGGVMA